MEEDGLLEDMKFDAELEGFFNGTGHTVNLQPSPLAFGSPSEEQTPLKAEGAAKTDAETGAATGAAAAAAAAATALMGGRLGMAQTMLSGAMGNLAGAAVPTSLQPVKEQATSFLSKAQPWKDFIWPLSIPSASEGCSRITANIYNFQTNYAILFMVQLVMSIVMQPSALISIGLTISAWLFFLKKNADPEWQPKMGGVVMNSMQRWSLLVASTALILLFFVGGVIINSIMMFVMFTLLHGLVHDASGKGMPGSESPPVPV
eukprot:TRINITY_DN9763_c1_g1_i1.p1 TRINITY_DN9763_c1_g1~~TRINITY_DN9763_c1_g1_i1.p1  ORF type:complete len:261 (+),score=70.37 TRINITY_DN9763_c1_g1_i1:114-896(+)